MAASVAVALNGNTVPHFVGALALIAASVLWLAWRRRNVRPPKAA